MSERISAVPVPEVKGAKLETYKLTAEELQTIKRELGVINKLRGLIEVLPDDLRPEEVEAILRGFVEEVKNSFSQDKIGKAEEINRLNKERFKKDGPKNALQRMGFLQRNSEVNFIGYIFRLAESLIKKNRQVNRCGKTTGEVVEEIRNACQVKLDEDKILRIIFSAFDIALILNEEDFNGLDKGIDSSSWRAFKIEDQPFVFLNGEGKNETEIEDDLRHEHLHNITEDPLYILEYGSKQIDRIRKRIKRTKKNKKEEAKLLDYLKRGLKVDEDVNGLHEEVVAAIKETLKKNNFKNFTTLRSEYDLVAGGLVEEIKECEFESVKTFLLNYLELFKKKYASVLGNIRISVAIARRMNDKDAINRVELLFQVLKPTEYWKIKEVLKDDYGAERVEKAERDWVVSQSMNGVVNRIEEALKQR